MRDFIKDNLKNALVPIIQHCPNFQIFIVQQPLNGISGYIADAFKTYASRRLRSVHWNLIGDAFSKVIWALVSLPCLITAHIDIGIGFTPSLIQFGRHWYQPIWHTDVVTTHGLNLVFLDLNLTGPRSPCWCIHDPQYISAHPLILSRLTQTGK